MSTLIPALVPIVTLPVPMATLPPLPTTAVKVVQVVIQPMVLKTDTGSGVHTVRLGASLRDRATLPSPLRGLGPSGGYPSRLRSLTLTARSACPAARCAHRRCRTDTPVLHSTAQRAAPPCPPRDRAARRARRRARLARPSPAAPAHAIAPARRRGTPCVAGVGFAVHRTPHCAVHRRPHQCGHRGARFSRRAAHDPVQHPLHSRPLNRRGGSDEPRSPVTISRTLMQQAWPSRPPGAALGLTPDAPWVHTCLRCEGVRWGDRQE